MPTNISNITMTPTPRGTATATPTIHNTSNASGEVVAHVGRDQVPVVVEQGPAWLARLAYQPPPWLDTVLAVVVFVVLGLAGVGYYRHGIDEDVLQEMSEAVLTGVCVLVVAAVVRSPAIPGSYVAKVLVAGGGGWLLAQAVVRGVERATGGHGSDSA